MSIYRHILLSAALLLLSAAPAGATSTKPGGPGAARAAERVQQQSLTEGWKFREAGKSDWHRATVPGTVHTDLMSAGLIPDPFVGQNERAVQWVDKVDWVYETTFDLNPAIASMSEVNLVFDGLDTYADVYVNDSLVLKANNMFRRWDVPVKQLLRPRANTLRVYFHSPIKVDLPKFEALPFHYEAGNDQSENGGIFDKRVSVFARKAGYHYGWDWGPRLVTSGIWRPVRLEAWDGYRIEDVFVRTLSISKRKADMMAAVEIAAQAETEAELRVLADGKRVRTQKITLQKGLNNIEVPFELKSPRLWWCNGMGEPNLYDIEIEVVADGEVLAAGARRVGVRRIEVVRDEDADGRSFYFKLNGLPVFAKGANYIPCDNFLPRVTPEIYRRTVQDAADANMNMLRVWGGGIYEDDYFYQLCDSLGIMVWQDFMFACSMYPSEGELLENIRAEAIDNLKRLRNHPSIALWCGNNECLEAWYNWGWRRRYTEQGVADIIWKQYNDLYNDVLPKAVAAYAPDAFYWPSSPFSRPDGSPEPNRGDAHLWTVWGGGEPIDTYNDKRSRFFSEYGFQSFPEIQTVRKYAPDSAMHHIDSDVMLAHQRGGTSANQKIENYLLASYPQPNDFESLLYMSQVLQGDAIRTAILAHRRDKPYCMGSLFWQHNDCWPVASWSSRDYFGRWKAQHYFAKQAYRDIAVSAIAKGDSLRISVVSDRLGTTSGRLNITVGTLDGSTVKTLSVPMRIAPQGVASASFALPELFASEPRANTYVDATFSSGTDSYSDIYFPLPQKDMAFATPHISIEIAEHTPPTTPAGMHNYTLRVASDTYARALRLALEGDDNYFFDDNYFDVLPGRTRTIGVRTRLQPSELLPAISWLTLQTASCLPESAH